MEKIFTLMKTLTAAFRDLLFPRRKRNSRIVNNENVSTTGGYGTGTTVNNKFRYMNDPDMSGSFLFFEQAVIDGQQSIEDDKKIKSKEELKKVNDELAQRNVPKPAHNNWRGRVNDDLAACTAVDDPLFPPIKNSYKRKNDNINVDHIFTINNTTINTNTTRTNKNGPAWPGSFSFLSMIISAVLKSFKQDDLSKNLKPVFIPIRICDKSNMRFSQNRSNQKNKNRI
jgi:hypothetical protein